MKNIPEIQIAKFADQWENGELIINSGERPIRMQHSDWTAQELLLLWEFGADVIRFEKGKGVWTHTHTGDHILLTLKWEWFVEYNWVDHALEPWVAYMVPGSVEHAIKATSELILMAIANNHRPAWSKERLDVVEK
jgi:hypothetical protein